MKKTRVILFGSIPTLKPSKRSLVSHTVFHTDQILKVLPDGHKWIIEPKRDGIRCQLHKNGGRIVLISDEEKTLSPERLALIIKEAREVFPAKCIIDGELLLLGEEGKSSQGHQAIAGYVHKHGAPTREEANKLRYIYWDILYLNGKDLTSEPLFKRKQLLKFREALHIKENNYAVVAENLKQLRFTIKTKGSAEGAMIKAADSTYWDDNLIFKYKHFYDLDVRVAKVIPRINGQVYVCEDREGNIIGNTYKQQYLRAKSGDVIRVMVTKVYRHRDPKTGDYKYRWYSPIIKRPEELATGLKAEDRIIKRHPKAIDGQAVLKKIWEITGKVKK